MQSCCLLWFIPFMRWLLLIFNKQDFFCYIFKFLNITKEEKVILLQQYIFVMIQICRKKEFLIKISRLVVLLMYEKMSDVNKLVQLMIQVVSVLESSSLDQ